MPDQRAPCAANLECLLVSCFRLAVCCSMLLMFTAPAFAHTVALLRPPSHSPSTTEILARLRGELLSVGFEVVFRDHLESEATVMGAEVWQHALAEEDEVDAAIDVVGEVAPFAVDVWIIDSAREFHLAARVTPETKVENASKRLAIQASEVLRARLFETHLAARDRRYPVAPSTGATAGGAAVKAETETRTEPRQLGFELGAAVLASVDRVGPALLPIGRLDFAVGPEVLLQATVAGFGTQPVIETSAGNARVGTEYALFGTCYRMNRNRWLNPLAAISAGAVRTSVEGRAESPRVGHSVAQWSFLLDASLGAAFDLTRHYSVALAAHAQLAEPYVAIRFAEQRVASAGRPNLLLSLTLGAWP